MSRLGKRILGDPGADSRGERRIKRAKVTFCGRHHEWSGEISWLLIGQQKIQCHQICAQSEARTSCKLSLAPNFCWHRLRPCNLPLAPTICPRVSEDGVNAVARIQRSWKFRVLCSRYLHLSAEKKLSSTTVHGFKITKGSFQNDSHNVRKVSSPLASSYRVGSTWSWIRYKRLLADLAERKLWTQFCVYLLFIWRKP